MTCRYKQIKLRQPRIGTWIMIQILKERSNPKREIRADGKRSEDANLGVVAELAFKRLHKIESSACCSASRFPTPWYLGGPSPAPWCPGETHGSLEGRAHLLAATAASRESRRTCSYSASTGLLALRAPSSSVTHPPADELCLCGE
jgi:hypothetical protein